MLQWGSASPMAGLRKTVESAAKPSVIRILLNQTVNKLQQEIMISWLQLFRSCEYVNPDSI